MNESLNFIYFVYFREQFVLHQSLLCRCHHKHTVIEESWALVHDQKEPSCLEEAVEVARACGHEASWTPSPPGEVFQARQAETPGHIHKERNFRFLECVLLPSCGTVLKIQELSVTLCPMGPVDHEWLVKKFFSVSWINNVTFVHIISWDRLE